jgi:succinate dehydrogenase / fumarate reductase flavoprotein subunit
MQDNVGIIRVEHELKKAVDELQRLKKDAENVKAPGSSQYNPGWHEAISMRSMMITAEAVTRAGLERKESRGAHTRADFFGEDKEWQKYNLVIRKGNDGNMEVEKVTRTSSSPELERIANSSIEGLEAEVVAERASVKVS